MPESSRLSPDSDHDCDPDDDPQVGLLVRHSNHSTQIARSAEHIPLAATIGTTPGMATHKACFWTLFSKSILGEHHCLLFLPVSNSLILVLSSEGFIEAATPFTDLDLVSCLASWINIQWKSEKANRQRNVCSQTWTTPVGGGSGGSQPGVGPGQGRTWCPLKLHLTTYKNTKATYSSFKRLSGILYLKLFIHHIAGTSIKKIKNWTIT